MTIIKNKKKHNRKVPWENLDNIADILPHLSNNKTRVILKHQVGCLMTCCESLHSRSEMF